MTETVSHTDSEIPRMLYAASSLPLPPCRGCGGPLIFQSVGITLVENGVKVDLTVDAPVCAARQCKWNGGRRSKVRCVMCGAAQPTYNPVRKAFLCQRHNV